MEKELREAFDLLMVRCAQLVSELPQRDRPAPPDHERALDEIVRSWRVTERFDIPSRDVAMALIPRLRMAQPLIGVAWHSAVQQEMLGDKTADEYDVLELLLVDHWHSDLRSRWLAGAD